MRRGSEQRRGATALGAVGSLVLAALVLAFVPGSAGDEFRQLTGIRAPDRLLRIVHADEGGGTVAYLVTQPGTTTPVSFSPCRPIHYVVNPEGGPRDYRAFIEPAVAEASKRSGFAFVDDGTTDDRTFVHRAAGAPVLIGFAGPGDEPGLDLSGPAVGLGGSTSLEVRPGFLQSVTGMVALESDWFVDASRRGARRQQQAVVMHELGHVLGLGHVKDRGELMYDENVGRSSYGPGDLEGLARLGAVSC